MACNVIERLSESTIQSQMEVIEFFIRRTEDPKSNEEYTEAILDFLLERENVPNFCNYHLIGPKYSLGCLTGTFLYHYISEENTELQTRELTRLLNFVKGFRPCSSGLLKMTTTAKLIDLLDKFGFPIHYYKPFNTPLRIYYIPFGRADTNALYYPHVNAIACFKPKQDCLHPEYIFLHEIGHLFLYNLTKDPRKVPESFVEFNERHNPSYKGDLLEIFVDFFSMAVMMDSEYESGNPLLKKSSTKVKTLVRNYFTELIDNINRKV